MSGVIGIIYILLVLRIYTLTLHYNKFDGIRGFTIIVPLFVLYTLIRMIYLKSFRLFVESIKHPYKMYVIIGFQFLRDVKKELKI